MTKKDILKLLKKHDIEISAELENDLADGYKDVKVFKPDAWEKYIGNKKTEWQTELDSKSKRETLVKDTLTKHKIKANRIDAFKKLYDLDNIDEKELEATIKKGITEYPEFKEIGTPPTATDSTKKVIEVKEHSKPEVKKPDYTI